LIKMFLLQTGPATVHSAAFYRSAQNKHHIGVAVVRAAISILPRSAYAASLLIRRARAARSPSQKDRSSRGGREYIVMPTTRLTKLFAIFLHKCAVFLR
jgi:hypothetical protein